MVMFHSYVSLPEGMCHKLTYLRIILLNLIDIYWPMKKSPTAVKPIRPHSVAKPECFSDSQLHPWDIGSKIHPQKKLGTSPTFFGPEIPKRIPLPLHGSFTRKPDKLSDMGSFSGPLRSEDHFHLLGSETSRGQWFSDGIWVPGNIERWTKKERWLWIPGKAIVDWSLETIGKLVFQMISTMKSAGKTWMSRSLKQFPVVFCHDSMVVKQVHFYVLRLWVEILRGKGRPYLQVVVFHGWSTSNPGEIDLSRIFEVNPMPCLPSPIGLTNSQWDDVRYDPQSDATHVIGFAMVCQRWSPSMWDSSDGMPPGASPVSGTLWRIPAHETRSSGCVPSFPGAPTWNDSRLERRKHLDGTRWTLTNVLTVSTMVNIDIGNDASSHHLPLWLRDGAWGGDTPQKSAGEAASELPFFCWFSPPFLLFLVVNSLFVAGSVPFFWCLVIRPFCVEFLGNCWLVI